MGEHKVVDFRSKSKIIDFKGSLIGDTPSTRSLNRVAMHVLIVGIKQKIQVLESTPLFEI